MCEARTLHAELTAKANQLRHELAEVEQALGLPSTASPSPANPSPEALLLQAVRQIMTASTIESLFEVVVRAAEELTGAHTCVIKHECEDYEALLGDDDTNPGNGLRRRRENKTGEHWTAFRQWLGAGPSVRYSETELLDHPLMAKLPAGHPPVRGLAGALIYDQNSAPAGLIMVSHKDSGDFTAQDEQNLVQLAQFASLRLHHLESRAAIEELALLADQQAAELSAVFSAMSAPMLVCDIEERITRVNPALILSLGYDPTGQQARQVADATYWLDADGNPIEHNNLMITAALRGATRLNVPMDLIGPTGTARHVLISTAPLRSTQGVIGAVMVVNDATENYEALKEQERLLQELRASKQALAHSERLYRSIGELIPHGVWIADPKGLGSYVSHSFADLVGQNLSEATVAQRLALYAPDDQPKVLEAWEKHGTGNS